MAEFEYLPRARRRAFLENIRRKARLKSERMYEEQFKDIDSANRWSRLYPQSCFYRRVMKSDGHWLYGGCGRARCGLCQPREEQARYVREDARLDAEREQWIRGDFTGESPGEDAPRPVSEPEAPFTEWGVSVAEALAAFPLRYGHVHEGGDYKAAFSLYAAHRTEPQAAPVNDGPPGHSRQAVRY